MCPSPTRLRGFEPLEERCLPSTFGIPWADPNHLTLSFAGDGTATALGASNLYQALASSGSAQAWQREILRAFQTWAMHANIDIGLVADGGQALGALGAVQGDRRFGDIRVAGAAIAPDLIANTSPFSWTGTTYSGDVVFNTAQPFALGDRAGAFDLYTVALHEAGHVFGLTDDCEDAASVLWGWYQGLASLTSGNISALQALYGVRAADAFDAAGSNNTRAYADSLPKGPAGGSRFLATADLTSLADTDFYKFNVPALLPTLSQVVVRLKASGISLLTAGVTVFNSAGKVVASGLSSDPLGNDLTLQFRPALLGGTYYVKVDGAGNGVFDVGGYKLAVDFLSLGGVLAPITNTVEAVLDGHTNDLLATALNLSPPATSDARFDAIYRGVIEDRWDVDTYRISTRQFQPGAPVTLNVMAWGLDAGTLDPRVRLYDASGRPVAFQVLANDAGLFSLQAPEAVAGDYYVQVAARDSGGGHATGRYFLAADFNRSAPILHDGVSTGTVHATDTDTGGLAIEKAGLFQFALAADQWVGAGGAVTMFVYDEYGNLAFQMTAAAGQPMTTTFQYLRAGTYSVRYSSTASAANPVTYSLYMLILSDDVGTYSTTTSTSTQSGTSGSTTTSSSSYTYSGSSTTKPSRPGYTF